MKYKSLLFLLSLSVILIGCWYKEKSIAININKPTMKIVKEISTLEKIIKNLNQYSWKIDYSTGAYWSNLPISWTWKFVSLQSSWNIWSLIISDLYNNKETIKKTLVITWWKLLYNNNFSINIPKNTLSRWGIFYENTNELNNIFINPEWYDDVISPKWVNIRIDKINNLTWDFCNPYDLSHFKKDYRDTMKKKWYFSVTKKNIDDTEVTISYLKKYYSDDSDLSFQWLFNGRLGNYCFVKEDKRYKISVSLIDKKSISNILESFQFTD